MAQVCEVWKEVLKPMPAAAQLFANISQSYGSPRVSLWKLLVDHLSYVKNSYTWNSMVWYNCLAHRRNFCTGFNCFAWRVTVSVQFSVQFSVQLSHRRYCCTCLALLVILMVRQGPAGESLRGHTRLAEFV